MRSDHKWSFRVEPTMDDPTKLSTSSDQSKLGMVGSSSLRSVRTGATNAITLM